MTEYKYEEEINFQLKEISIDAAASKRFKTEFE